MERDSNKSLADLSITEFLNSFSIPVVFGSISTAFFFSRFFRTDLPLSFYWLLPSTVWLIYTIDHLMDGLKLGESASALRHQIHYRYRKELKFICFLLVCINFPLAIITLPPHFLISGMLLSVFVLLYMFLIHRTKLSGKLWWKEVLIAFGVTYGMAILPGIPQSLQPDPAAVLLLLIFFGINLINLMIFSYFDHEMDRSDGFASSSSKYGVERLESIITRMLIITFALIAIWTFLVPHQRKLPVIMVLMVMLNVLGMIMFRKDLFKEDGKYRLWGDMIYLAPAIIWFILKDKPVF